MMEEKCLDCKWCEVSKNLEMALLENLFLDAKFQKKKQKIKMNVLKADENRILE